MSSIVEDVLIEAGDCEDHSKRSTCKGLFLNLQVISRLMDELIVYFYKYN